MTDEFTSLARKNSHLVNLEKYKVNYPSLSLYSASFLFEAWNKKVIYTSDIGSEGDLLLFEDYVADIFISEVTHISPLAIIEKIIKINPGKVYLTHYSDEDIPTISEILANLPSDLKEKVKLATDNLSFEI
jgi:ribonuclease BN (tRNA processing enzyme)